MSQSHINNFIKIKRTWIEKHVRRMQSSPQRPELTQTEIDMLKKQARLVLPKRLEYYSKRMGISYADVKITSAATRWGSCSGKNVICFSYRLMLTPQEAQDYVVVHELAHVVHKHHKEQFWALVASVFPDYKQRRALLKL